MEDLFDPILVKNLRDAKAALARHGIVILRTIQSELEPAILVKVRDSMASSQGRLNRMSDEDLDEFMGEVRKAATKAATELAALHTHLLTKLGSEYVVDLVKELDGINQLFSWERIAKVTDPVSVLLVSKGFDRIELDGPQEVSDAFAVELTEKWPRSFDRFKVLADETASKIKDMGAKPATKEPTPAKTRKKSKKKR